MCDGEKQYLCPILLDLSAVVTIKVTDDVYRVVDSTHG
jgi:hypothetical protein